MSRLAWSGPEPTGQGRPRSPYAHFAMDLAGSSSTGPLYGEAAGCLRARNGKVEARPVFDGTADAFDADLFAAPILLPRRFVNPQLWDPGFEPLELAPRRDDPPDWLGGAPVLVGIVDDAIAFANARFRLHPRRGRMRTRVDYLWLQGAPFDRRGDPTLPFGREVRREVIDAALSEHALGGGRIDEDALYRDPGIGAIDMGAPEYTNAALGATHGTAVLDCAAGFDPDDPDAARAPLAVVCLPPQVTTDTLGTLSELHIAAAVQRILDHARRRRVELGAGLPVVINISLALTGGPKDGTDRLDDFLKQAADAYLAATGAEARFVLPTGNHRQSATYARIPDKAMADRLNQSELDQSELNKSEGRTLAWRLPPDDATPSFLEIWSTKRGERPKGPTLMARITPAGGTVGFPAANKFGEYFELKHDDRHVGRLYVDWVPVDPDNEPGPGRERLTFAVMPTVGYGQTILPGDWRIELEVTDPGACPLDLFVQRDDSVQGFRRRGRQSVLHDPGYAVWDATGRIMLDDGAGAALVRRAGSISSYATGSTAVVATSGYAGAIPDEVWFAGMPLAGRGAGIVPEAVERSRVRHGIRAAASASGGRWTCSGTSFAAGRRTRRELEKLGGPACPAHHAGRANAL